MVKRGAYLALKRMDRWAGISWVPTKPRSEGCMLWLPMMKEAAALLEGPLWKRSLSV